MIIRKQIKKILMNDLIKQTGVILFSLITGITAILFFAEPPTEFQKEILITLSIICASIISICFILSELTNNYSQTDKMWSIAPIIYTWTIAYMTDFNLRIVIMSVLISIWGIRLSYNFGRAGGYSIKFWAGHEDYRWKIIKSKQSFKNPIIWHSFNFFFIAAYQNILVMLISLPVLASYTESAPKINYIDIILCILTAGMIIFETVADQQQWNFQKEKKKRIMNNEPLTNGFEKGFVHKGLWSISRHPNYFAEQSIWVLIWLFSVNVTENWGNFSIIGCILLIILFQGSSRFSENISASKYPEYSIYQKEIGKFFPKIFRKKAFYN